MRFVFPLLFVQVLAGSALAQRPVATAADSRLTVALDSAAHRHQESANLAGIAVSVVRRGKPFLIRNYGFADLEHDVPIVPQTVFALGSMTKQFTAVAIHHLAEQQRLDLEADVRTYLPELDTHGRIVPVWRLLDDTSGLAGYTGLPAFGLVSLQTLRRDTIIGLIKWEPLMFEPGFRMIYDHSGFFLAAMIVARVSGQSFETYLTDHLFAPLGMDDSRYCDESAVVKQRACGYWTDRDGIRHNATRVNHTWPYGAGSPCGSARDLVRWNEALHHGRVLGVEEYRRLVTPRPPDHSRWSEGARGASVRRRLDLCGGTHSIPVRSEGRVDAYASSRASLAKQ